MFGERLDPWLRYHMRVEIEWRIFRPLFYEPAHFWWESASMNWAVVCAGACGMAALLLEDDRERLAGMIDRCVRTMECFLEGFGEDGGCAEGVGYWQYGFGYHVYFAEMLYEYTHAKIDLLAGERIRRIASFPAAVSLGNGNFINYSDGSAHVDIRPGLIVRLAERIVPELLLSRTCGTATVTVPLRVSRFWVCRSWHSRAAQRWVGAIRRCATDCVRLAWHE